MQTKKRKKLRYKYRLSIINEDTFEEVWRSRLSRFNVITLSILFSLLIIGLTVSAIVFTSLKEYIPGYPDAKVRETMVINALQTDTLYQKVHQQSRFYSVVRAIMNDEIPDDWKAHIDSTDTVDVNRYFVNEMNLRPSPEDSAFRAQLYEEEKYNLSIFEQIKNSEEDKVVFSLPMKGLVSQSFDESKLHFGVDIVGIPNQKIMTVADGTIIMAEWTMNTGYVIQVQHAQNLISIYKHNSSLLKQVGNKVKSGEAIAIIGNTGEYSSGAHLHLELWENGTPLNPENYIIF